MPAFIIEKIYSLGFRGKRRPPRTGTNPTKRIRLGGSMDLKAILGNAYTEDLEKSIKKAIGESFVPRADFNSKNEELKARTTEIAERDKQLEALKSQAAGSEVLQAEIKKLQDQNVLAEKEYQIKLAAQERDFALKDVLKNTHKAHDAVSVIPHLKQDTIIFKDKAFTGLEEQIKALKESKPFLFEGDNVPSGTGGVPGALPNVGGEATSAWDSMQFTGVRANPAKK